MGERPQGASKGLLGCVLVPVAFLAVMLTLGTLGFVGKVLLYGPEGPGGAKPIAVLMSIGILASLAAFFWLIAKRLIAALRGQDVPYLMPPWVGLIVGVVFGAFSLIVLVMALTGAIKSTDRDTGRALSGAILFLSFASIAVRSLFQQRALKRAKAAAENPAATGI